MIQFTIRKHKENGHEDRKTSTVFENLMLLPDDVFWNILKKATANEDILPDKADLLEEYEFWPSWNATTPHPTGNKNTVEPDVFFRFKKLDVIIEAKDLDNKQDSNQWKREFIAYLNEHKTDGKDVYLLAVGGNSDYKVEQPLPFIGYRCPIVKYRWEDLLFATLDYEKNELDKYQPEMQSQIKRILSNIKDGFTICDIKNYRHKMELKGIKNLYRLLEAFNKAIKNLESKSYTLKLPKNIYTIDHYGVSFGVYPQHLKIARNFITLSIAFWFKEQEEIWIGVDKRENPTINLALLIYDDKKITSELVKQPYLEDNIVYYFKASEKFYEKFNKLEDNDFDAQVELIKQMIDDVCIYLV